MIRCLVHPTRLVAASLLAFGVLCGSPIARAETGPAIAVRVGEHPDFDRIVFDWPHDVKYNVARTGSHVTVTFAASGHMLTGSDLQRLSRIKGFSTSAGADNLVVSFNVNSSANLKDFASGKSIVIDVKGGSAPQDAKPQEPEKTPEKTAADKQPAPSNPPEDKKPQETAAPQTTAPTTPSTTQAATQPPTIITPPESTPDNKPLGIKAPDLGSEKKSTTTTNITPPVPQPDKQSTPPVAATTTTAATSTVMPPPKSAPVANVTRTSNAGVTLADLGDQPLLVASLDPHASIRAAVYARGGYGYIIFDRKLTLSASALVAGQQAARVALEALDLPKASGFRFVMPSTASLRATRKDTAWQIFLSKEAPDVPVSTSLVPQPDFALGARFLLPLPDAPEPVKMTDPIVGDSLIIVPLEQNEAFSVTRQMADFDVLPAAQGLVIKPLMDKLIARAVSDGVEITAEGGLHLSSTNDTGAIQQSAQKTKAAAAGKSLFDFADWRGKPEETFTKTRQRLQQTIVDVPEAERNRARLELARFYFAHGYGEEASALLKYLVKQVPDLMAHADFLALLGASEIISYHPDEGLKYLDTPLLKDQPEIELWQAIGHAQLRDWSDAEEKFAITESILGGYPEPFYSRFSVLAVEAALATNKDHEAGDWLDRLENNPHSNEILPAISYLHGALHAKSGRAAAAEDDWKTAKDSNDRLYKVRAELALIDLSVSNGSLTAAQAADRLEALRFAWRGDDLEVDILHRLGQFYIQAKNVKAGLNVLSRTVQLYPDSPMTPQIQAEMSSIFHDVFLTELGKEIPPLDMLTLYQQYRNLIPKGDDGIAVTRNLAERLVAIDLLDQAADLLEDLVKNRLQGEDKARIGLRLAGIRLLDHKPDQAMKALDYDNNESLPSDVSYERTLLRAKALSDQHDDDTALSLLQSSTRESAKVLRADIQLHGQHWTDASKTLLDLIGAPPRAGTNLRQDQIQWLINCAIAMSMDNNLTGLDKLAIDYGAAMSGTPESGTFRLLTQPEATGQSKDITAAQSRIADVDMFQDFLNSYRKAGDAGKDSKTAKP